MSKIRVNTLETVDAASSVAVSDLAAASTHPAASSGAHAASAISNTPAGNIAATTVQAAINELDSDKFAKTGGTITGPVTVVGADDVSTFFKNTSGMLSVRPFVTSYTTAQIASLDGPGTAYAPLAIGGSITTLETNGVEQLRIGTSGNVLVTGGGALGYGVGSGGTVTQATSKSTAVTLNKPSGRIVLNGAALPAGTAVSFQLNNSQISAGDTVSINVYAATATLGAYRLLADRADAGYCFVVVQSIDGVTRSEAFSIQFNVHKGATA